MAVCSGFVSREDDFVFALRASEAERISALLDDVVAAQFKNVGRCFYCGITAGECESFSGVHYPGCLVDEARRLRTLLLHASNEEGSFLL